MFFKKCYSVKVLLSKALIDSYISHDELVLLNNVLWGYSEVKKERKNYFGTYYIKTMEAYCVICKKNILLAKIQVSKKLNKID